MPHPAVTITIAQVPTGDGLRYRVTRPFYGSQVHLGEFATETEALEFASDFKDRLKAIWGHPVEVKKHSSHR